MKLVKYIREDALLGRFFDPFVFEETPACDMNAQQVYLDEVDACDLYVGILGERYGNEVRPGVSATECEYDRATELGKCRLIFVLDTTGRDDLEASFVAKIERTVTRKSFSGYDDLKTAVYGALVRHLEACGYVRMSPFDVSFDTECTVADLDVGKIDDFIRRVRRTGKITVPDDADAGWVLDKLEALSSGGTVSNSAVLLFGKEPQRKFLASQVKCLQYWGTHVERPIPSYHFYNGGLIEMIEAALDFVMSRVDHEIGEPGPDGSAMGRDELPRLAVREAIVNAVCHRDYADNGSVQVMLFRDRLEIINPGPLPKGWTVDRLLRTHDSKSRNLTLAQALNWAGYVEQSGNGTESIIQRCEAQGLATPQYLPDNVDFKIVIWRKGYGAPTGAPTGAPRGAPTGAPTGIPVANKQEKPLFFDLPSGKQGEILRWLWDSPLKKGEIAAKMGVGKKTRTLKKAVDVLFSDGLVEYTIPERPDHKQQQYRLTEKGREMMKAHLSMMPQGKS